MLESIYKNLNETSIILIGIAIMLFASFLMTRLTKLAKLPNVTAYIFTGILIGPNVLNLISPNLIDGTNFLTDIALAFIAFGVGRFFKLDVLKKSGGKIIVITLFESILAAVVVFLGMMFIFDLPFEFALLLGAIASATAPASTMMTIRQTQAKGNFVDTILQVVALDDAVALLLFSVSMSVITAVDTSSGFNLWIIAEPILYNFATVVLGFLWGIALHLFIPKRRSTDNRLIIVLAMIMFFVGITAALNISPLLGCMAMGMAYINKSKDETIFKQLDYFSPPILSLFFVTSGMKLDLNILVSLGLIGVVYFLIRIAGKYAGATLGSVVSNSTPENKKFLGLALIPQAGVSIGLAALGARILIENDLPHYAKMLTTIIIASGILYEMVGPACAKLSLYLSKSYEVANKPIRTKKLKVAVIDEAVDIGVQQPSEINHISEQALDKEKVKTLK